MAERAERKARKWVEVIQMNEPVAEMLMNPASTHLLCWVQEREVDIPRIEICISSYGPFGS